MGVVASAGELAVAEALVAKLAAAQGSLEELQPLRHQLLLHRKRIASGFAPAAAPPWANRRLPIVGK